jgi:DNA-binding beta-propeller fold protein YncE
VWQIVSGGDLNPGNLTMTALAPIGLAISPNGSHLYVASAASQGVDVWTVNGASITHLAGPYQVFTNGLSYIAINSAGTLLVALNVVDRTVSSFAITGSGTLGFAPQAAYSLGEAAGNPKAIVAR